jgi:acyl carrier protein
MTLAPQPSRKELPDQISCRLFSFKLPKTFIDFQSTQHGKTRPSALICKLLNICGQTLDSLGLVTLILNIEDKLSEKFGLNITLADDRAMSQKNSPFRSTESLTEYIYSIENTVRE